MTPQQHQRVKALFTAASRLEPGAPRVALLDQQCPDDAEVRAEVVALLSADDDPIGSLKTPALGVNIGKTLGAALRAMGPTEMPTRLGRYRILRILGEGGMGMVSVAEQDKPRRTVALKVIQGGPGSRTLLRRFEHGAELLGRLQHPGIAQIFEAGSAPSPQGPVPFIAMELIEGEVLTKHVESQHLGTRERLELVAKVCDAVQYAHQRGVIHRGLKPANILVDARGQPKVLDIGVARAAQGDADFTTMRTSMGQLIGTLPYMSPEQVLADPEGIDTRSDVYSLGVVLYQVLTGKLPHNLESRSLPEAARVIGLVAFSGYALWQSEKSAALAERASREATRANDAGDRLAAELMVSNIERGRLLAASGNLSGAEDLFWGEHLAAPGSPYTRWALWDLYSRQPVLCTKRVIPEGPAALGLALCADGRMYAVSCMGGYASLYDARTFVYIEDVRGPSKDVYGVALSPDASMIALSGSDDGTISIQSLIGPHDERRFCGHTGRVWSVAFSPDGGLLAAGAKDNVTIFDLRYFDRHAAGNAAFQIERLRREQEMRGTPEEHVLRRGGVNK